MNESTSEELDALFIVVSEHLSLAAFDEDVQGFEHDIGIHAMEF